MGDLGCDRACLTALKPLEVAAYLRVGGWRREAEIGDMGSIWVLPARGDRDEADITLPLRRDLGDFALRMGDVLRTLAGVEQRPAAEVLRDLMTISSDLVRVRAPGRTKPGWVPIEQAVAFVERSRDMTLAAAGAAISKRLSMPARILSFLPVNGPAAPLVAWLAVAVARRSAAEPSERG